MPFPAGSAKNVKRSKVPPKKPYQRPTYRRPPPGSLLFPGQKGLNELKYVDTFTTLSPGAAAATASTGVLLNALVPGTTAQTRIGRQVTLKSLYLRADATLAATSTGGGQHAPPDCLRQGV